MTNLSEKFENTLPKIKNLKYLFDLQDIEINREDGTPLDKYTFKCIKILLDKGCQFFDDGELNGIMPNDSIELGNDRNWYTPITLNDIIEHPSTLVDLTKPLYNLILSSNIIDRFINLKFLSYYDIYIDTDFFNTYKEKEKNTILISMMKKDRLTILNYKQLIQQYCNGKLNPDLIKIINTKDRHLTERPSDFEQYIKSISSLSEDERSPWSIYLYYKFYKNWRIDNTQEDQFTNQDYMSLIRDTRVEYYENECLYFLLLNKSKILSSQVNLRKLILLFMLLMNEWNIIRNLGFDREYTQLYSLSKRLDLSTYLLRELFKFNLLEAYQIKFKRVTKNENINGMSHNDRLQSSYFLPFDVIKQIIVLSILIRINGDVLSLFEELGTIIKYNLQPNIYRYNNNETEFTFNFEEKNQIINLSHILQMPHNEDLYCITEVKTHSFGDFYDELLHIFDKFPDINYKDINKQDNKRLEFINFTSKYNKLLNIKYQDIKAHIFFKKPQNHALTEKYDQRNYNIFDPEPYTKEYLYRQVEQFNRSNSHNNI